VLTYASYGSTQQKREQNALCNLTSAGAASLRQKEYRKHHISATKIAVLGHACADLLQFTLSAGDPENFPFSTLFGLSICSVAAGEVLLDV
jgi:hypothetical protein